MTVPVTPGSSKTKAFIAAVIGNLVEWYEFTVYGFVAAVIGQLFFPSTDATTSLISSYAVFGLAFIVRPLGGLVFASIGAAPLLQGVGTAVHAKRINYVPFKNGWILPYYWTMSG